MLNAIVVTSDGNAYSLSDDGSVDTDDIDSLEDGTEYIVIGAYTGWYVYGDSGTSYLVGNDYDDVIYGYDPDSTYTDGEDDAADYIFGFDGDDWIEAGAGDDLIFGGDGSDTSSYMDSTSAISVDLSETLEDDAGTYSEASDGYGDTDDLYSIENIWGSVYDDSIEGSDDANILYGYDGDDTLIGNDGDDELISGDGDDTLEGDDGDDIIISTGGDDTAEGGDDADTFILAGGSLSISDFDADEGDTIVIYLEDYGATYDEDTGTVTLDDDDATTYDSLEDFASAYITFSDGSEYDLSEDGGIVTYETSSIDLTDYL
nr:calcium-binding protein [Roseibium sp. RKSG952]